MKKILLTVSSVAILIVPHLVFASVYISEIAWMGSVADANAEWIELYNDGAQQDVTGWTLTASDGQPSVTLSGHIKSNAHVLLERTDDSTVPTVHAFVIYTGALGNTGEVLELRDTHNTLIDSVDGSENWAVGGNNDTKETLQRSGVPPTGVWTTGVANPQGEGGGVLETEDEEEENATTSLSEKIASGGIILSASTNEAKKAPHLQPALTIELVDETTVAVGVPSTFSSRAYKESGKEVVIQDVVWNFGDGSTGKGREATHAFSYVGDYVVTVTGNRTGFLSEIKDSDSMIVHVIEPLVEIVHADTSYIEIQNKGSEILDISKFVLVSNGVHFRLPEGSMILPNSNVRFPKKVTKLSGTQVVLYAQDGTVFSQYGFSENVASLPLVQGEVLSAFTTKETVSAKKVASSTFVENTVDGDRVAEGSPLLASVVSANEGGVQEKAGDSTRIWWWLFGLAVAILSTILAVSLIRREREEIIAGYLIDAEEDGE